MIFQWLNVYCGIDDFSSNPMALPSVNHVNALCLGFPHCKKEIIMVSTWQKCFVDYICYIGKMFRTVWYIVCATKYYYLFLWYVVGLIGDTEFNIELEENKFNYEDRRKVTVSMPTFLYHYED